MKAEVKVGEEKEGVAREREMQKNFNFVSRICRKKTIVDNDRNSELIINLKCA